MAKFDMSEQMAELIETFRREWERHRAQTTEYRPPIYKCSHCRDTGFLNLYPSNSNKPSMGKVDTVMYCPYCRANMLRDISGIIAEYRELDIEKFPWKTYERDITKLRRTIESFVYDYRKWKDEGVGLYIYSDAKGSGKTMAANAICGSICTKYNIPVRFVKVEDYFSDFRRARDNQNKDVLFGEHIRKYFDTELLVIDDLGVSKIGDWDKDILHHLINERYKANKLCIITSNFIPEQLNIHAATIDRINDMCLILHFPEEPIRSRKALERKNRLMQYVDSYDRFVDSGRTPFEGGTEK